MTETAGELFARVRDQQAAGDFLGVLATARALMQHHPLKSSGFNVAAGALAHLGRADEAMQIVRRGLSLHPNDGKLHVTKLRLHISCEHSSEIHAYTTFQDAPVALLFDLARYQMSACDFESAEITVRKILRRSTGDSSAVRLLSLILLSLNRPQEALAALNEKVCAGPFDAKLCRTKYAVETVLGRTEDALASAQELVDFDASDKMAQYWVYSCLMSLGKFDEAWDHLGRAKEASPDFDYGKHSSHFRRYQQVKERLPQLTEAWEAGLKNRENPTESNFSTHSVPVIQYWSQGAPPTDVARVVEVWNGVLAEQGLGPIKVFDRRLAQEWIETHSPEFSRAFNDSFHFAMESDIFRVAFASKLDCIYLDIDSWPLSSAGSVIAQALSTQSSMLYFRTTQPLVNNSFFVGRSNSEFFRELTRQCAEIDLTDIPKVRETIYETFGPGRFNKVLRELASNGVRVCQSPAVDGLSQLNLENGETLLFANEFATAAQKPPFVLNYKGTDDYWKAVRRAKR